MFWLICEFHYGYTPLLLVSFNKKRRIEGKEVPDSYQESDGIHIKPTIQRKGQNRRHFCSKKLDDACLGDIVVCFHFLPNFMCFIVTCLYINFHLFLTLKSTLLVICSQFDQNASLKNIHCNHITFHPEMLC